MKNSLPETCPHGCGREDVDDLHLFWTCPEIAKYEEQIVAKTQYLVPKAVVGVEAAPCLWLRGLS